MAKTPFRVLFLCTGNACRSQMAEAILRHDGGDRFAVFSAGSHPAGFIHPIAIDALMNLGLSLRGQHSKGLDELDRLEFDLAITLCDSAASVCPTLPGNPPTVHWPLEDPSFHGGSASERLAFAVKTAQTLRQRLAVLIEQVSQGASGEGIVGVLQRLVDTA
jgi:arsenate reductase